MLFNPKMGHPINIVEKERYKIFKENIFVYLKEDGI